MPRIFGCEACDFNRAVEEASAIKINLSVVDFSLISLVTLCLLSKFLSHLSYLFPRYCLVFMTFRFCW